MVNSTEHNYIPIATFLYKSNIIVLQNMVSIMLTIFLPGNIENNENTSHLVQHKCCNNKGSNNNIIQAQLMS